MDIKDYIIRLDNDNYGWAFLWNNTISEIHKCSLKTEIISCIMPMLAIRMTECGFDTIKNIEGVSSIEEDTAGYLVDDYMDV